MSKPVKRKGNNKGSSLILVLIAMAFIGMLAAIILMLCLLNFKMKAIDSKAQDTFYSAETALDQIKAGLQSEVSDSYTAAYIGVLQQYSALTEAQRNKQFQTDYMLYLKDRLRDTEKGSATEAVQYYMMDQIISYVEDRLIYDSETGKGVKVNTIKGDQKDAYLVETENGLVIKNLSVSYYEEKEFVSNIHTDILLKIPDTNFTQTVNTPNLLEYSVVANDSLTTSRGEQAIAGNIYGGKEGMTLETGSQLAITNGKTIVTNKDITLSAGSKLTTDNTSSLWAKDLNVTSGTLELAGVTHISNDLVVADLKKASSTIKISGEYYGFGNPETVVKSEAVKENETDINKDVSEHPADYSSAMLINGRNVYMDLTKTSRLMLAGNAYIGTTLKNPENQDAKNGKTNANDVRTGESLTVKSNQIAYLVPTEYIGKGSQYGEKNPMLLSQLKDLRDDLKISTGAEDKAVVDLEKMKTDTHATDCEVAYYPYNGETMVYFYLKFSTVDAAREYFKEYYQANKAQMDDYLSFYTTGISLADSSSATFNLYGSAMVYKDKVSSIEENTTEQDSDSIEARQTSMQDSFMALKTKLITQYLQLSDSDIEAKDIFTNLVKTSDLQKAIKKYDTNNISYCTETLNTNLVGIISQAKTITLKKGTYGINNGDYMVVENKAQKTVTIYVGDETKEESKKIRVIVTTGDVVIDEGCKYTGLIVADGEVMMKINTSITSAPEDVAKVLQAEDEEHGKDKIMNYLKDADEYVYGGAVSGSVEDGQDQATAISELVMFKRWKKE